MTVTPNRELIQKWVTALRSGEYKQGRGHLRDGDEYCCLGVLCDISGAGKWRNDATVFVHFDGEEASTMPPPSIRRLVGIGASWQVTTKEGRREPLSYLNDDTGLSFGEIADLVEAEWLS